jgi:hypothetical protein
VVSDFAKTKFGEKLEKSCFFSVNFHHSKKLSLLWKKKIGKRRSNVMVVPT